MKLLTSSCKLLAAAGFASAVGFAADFAEYGAGADDPAYWDEVYRVQGHHGRRSYEWYGLGYDELRETLQRLLLQPLRETFWGEAAEVLVVGSGDSDLSSELAAEVGESGPEPRPRWLVTSLDFSAEVTERMRRRHPELKFLTMDARNLSSIEDGSFSAVVDKGLSDCLGDQAERRKYFQGLQQTLRVGGRMLVISQRKLEVASDTSPGDQKAASEDLLGFEEDDSWGYDVGADGWACVQERLLGPLFIEDDPTRPPFPQLGTEGTIPYYVLACSRVAETAETL
mmetsp:Transcript_63645/g.114575  ORF Transcript_63645/g.114575 Transcript_63645/m.114575 type:complete len:284 (+) Transcript_63645:62-913(+)